MICKQNINKWINFVYPFLTSFFQQARDLEQFQIFSNNFPSIFCNNFEISLLLLPKLSADYP